MATPTYTLIEEQVLGSSAASVTFSSIPSTYKDLVLECLFDNTSAGVSSLTFNGDTTTNYSETQIYGDGSTANSNRGTNGSNIGILYNPAGQPVTMLTQVMSYTSTNVYKTVLMRYGRAGSIVTAKVGLWRKTPEAITSIALASGNTFISGSTFRLWGVFG